MRPEVSFVKDRVCGCPLFGHFHQSRFFHTGFTFLFDCEEGATPYRLLVQACVFHFGGPFRPLASWLFFHVIPPLASLGRYYPLPLMMKLAPLETLYACVCLELQLHKESLEVSGRGWAGGDTGDLDGGSRL